MPELVYDSIPALDRATIESAIKRDDPDELVIIVLSALHGDDQDFSEKVCAPLAEHSHFNVRGNALLGLAHIARIHGKLNEVVVKPLILKALQDEHEYVRGQAHDAKEDIEHFLGWMF